MKIPKNQWIPAYAGMTEMTNLKLYRFHLKYIRCHSRVSGNLEKFISIGNFGMQIVIEKNI